MYFFNIPNLFILTSDKWTDISIYHANEVSDPVQTVGDPHPKTLKSAKFWEIKLSLVFVRRSVRIFSDLDRSFGIWTGFLGFFVLPVRDCGRIGWRVMELADFWMDGAERNGAQRRSGVKRSPSKNQPIPSPAIRFCHNHGPAT